MPLARWPARKNNQNESIGLGRASEERSHSPRLQSWERKTKHSPGFQPLLLRVAIENRTVRDDSFSKLRHVFVHLLNEVGILLFDDFASNLECRRDFAVFNCERDRKQLEPSDTFKVGEIPLKLVNLLLE